MRYKFNIDLRAKQAPPEDGFVPSEAPPKPPPQYQEMVANEQLEAVYQRLAKEARAGVVISKGYQHLLKRNGNESVTELRLTLEGGSLVRRVYERMGGDVQSLDDLFKRGLSGLDTDEARFAAFPGYELRFARYSVRDGKLVRVRMGRASFHQEHGGIVITAL